MSYAEDVNDEIIKAKIENAGYALDECTTRFYALFSLYKNNRRYFTDGFCVLNVFFFVNNRFVQSPATCKVIAFKAVARKYSASDIGAKT